MTIKDIYRKLIGMLTPAVGAGEARAMADDILQHVRGYTRTDIALYGYRELLPDTEQQMIAIAERVIGGEPLQYVLGKAYFHGRYFQVDKSTLIPRPETSQLIDIICDQWHSAKDLRVLDVGTGSGCIAVSLALDLPYADVDAVDISDGALAVARDNAKQLHGNVRFFRADALALCHTPVDGEQYDIIVSNPPYVLDSERATMDARVTDHEPSTALFVPDSDPLLFYRAIGAFAATHLAAGGVLYFEINPLCADALCQMLKAQGFANVDIQSDFRGHKRFAICQR